MPNFVAPRFTEAQVRTQERIIIASALQILHELPNLGKIPYALKYGIFDWTWPLRFVNGNEPYKGYKYYSPKAAEAIENGDIKNLKRDHIIPKKIMFEELCHLPENEINEERVRAIFEQKGEICVITDEEDLLLNSNGLRSSMPNLTEFPGPFARYRKASIIGGDHEIRVNTNLYKADGAI